jgi:hypothetical protein
MECQSNSALERRTLLHIQTAIHQMRKRVEEDERGTALACALCIILTRNRSSRRTRVHDQYDAQFSMNL